jgi:trehalose 6-phosphate synthase
LKLPWRNEVINALLAYDLVGLQTSRDLKNFLDCVETLHGVTAATRGNIRILWDPTSERRIRVGHFPIGIDVSEFSEPAELPEIQRRKQQLRKEMDVEHLVVSVDRLDYTKGIPYRIQAFRRLLERYPHVKRRVALLQIVVPSRAEVAEYQKLKSEIERLVTSANGELGEPGWLPIHHFFRSISRAELIALYQAANVALVTPLKDGMNLVAKEFCAVHNDNDGVLVLSEFAGAAEQLGEFSLLVNPYDIDGVANALMKAIDMPEAERKTRMSGLRDLIKKFDVMWWASSFLREAGISLVSAGAQNESVWHKFTGFLSASNSGEHW